MVYRDPTGCLTAFYFSPFEVRDDPNPSGDGLPHLRRIKLGGATTVPPLLGDGLDDAAVPEVVGPRVVDGAERISSTHLSLADGMRVTPRLARRGLRRSHQLGSTLALLLLPSRGRTFLGVGRLGFLGVEAA